MPCTIHLHGRLRKEFGPSFTLAVRTPAEAVRALCCLKPGIEPVLREGAWRVVRGPLKGGRRLGPDELSVNLDKEMHILAAGRGAGGGRGSGAGKTILGVVLIAAAVALAPWTGGASLAGTAGGVGGTAAGATGLGATAFTAFGASVTYGNIALFGAAMLMGGVSMLLSPSPGAMNGGPQDTKPSYLFNGQINMADQGLPVPLVLGKMRVPGIVISLGMDVVDMSDSQDLSAKIGRILR